MKFRKHLITILTFILSITAIMGLAITPIKAVKAEGEAVVDTFAISSTMSIRTGKKVENLEELGLRFTTEVNKDYADSLSDKDVKFGMLIVSKKQYNDVLGGELTHASMEVAGANIEDVWYIEDVKTLFYNEETGYYEYYASVLYDLVALKAGINKEIAANENAFGGITDVDLLVKYAYSTQLVAVPYAVIDGKTTYGAVSNPASAVHLANAALLQGVENAQIFAEKYLGTITEVNDLLVEQDGTLLGIDADEYAYLKDATFTDGDSYIAYDYNEFISGTKTTKTAGNKFALTSAITDGKVAGQNYSFGAYLPGYNYIRFNYQFVTDAFEVAEDFNIFLNQNKNTLDGYYVLANDIDASGFAMQHVKNEVKEDLTILTGTFNGRGHVVYDLTLGAGQTIVPKISGTAFFKNVAFYNTHVNQAKFITWYTDAPADNEHKVISNIYMHYAEDSKLPYGYKDNASSPAQNIVIEYPGEIDYYQYNEDGSVASTSFYPKTHLNSDYTWIGLMGVFGSLTSYNVANSNVLVINPNHYALAASGGWASTNYNSGAQYQYARNAKFAADGRPLENHPWTEAKNLFVAGVRDFATYADMEQAYLDIPEKGDVEEIDNQEKGFNYRLFQYNDCWLVVNGTPYWRSLYSTIKSTVNGEESNALKLGNDSDELALSYGDKTQTYSVMAGEELVAGEFKAETSCEYLTITKNAETNKYIVKMNSVVAENTKAIITLTALKQIDGAQTPDNAQDDVYVELTKTVEVLLLAPQMVVKANFNGENVESDTFTLNCAYDIHNVVMNDKLILSAYNSFSGEYFTNANLILTCENENLNVVYDEDKNEWTITLKNVVSESQNAQLILTAGELTKTINVLIKKSNAITGNITTKGIAKLDTTTGEFFYNGKVVEGITAATYYYSNTSKKLTVENGKFTNISSKVTGSSHDITQVKKRLVVSIDGTDVDTLAPSSNGLKSDFGNSTIRIVVNGYEYTFSASVEVATRVIDDAKDLEVFNLTGTDDVNDGYYIMIDNVDASEFVSSHDSSINFDSYRGNSSRLGFSGVFDGYGYTIKNLNVSKPESELPQELVNNAKVIAYPSAGLFGRLISSFIIKNVALDNVNADYAAIFAGVVSATTPDYACSLFSQIYVKHSDESLHTFGFIYDEIWQPGYGPIFEQVIVHASDADTTQYKGAYSHLSWIPANFERSNFKLVTLSYNTFTAQAHARTPDAFVLETKSSNPSRYMQDVITITNGYVCWPNKAAWGGSNTYDFKFAYNEQYFTDGKKLPYYVDPVSKKYVYVFKDGDNYADYYGAPKTVVYKLDDQGISTGEIDYEATYAAANTNMVNSANNAIDNGLIFIRLQKFNSAELLGASGQSFAAFNTAYWTITAENGPVWKTLF